MNTPNTATGTKKLNVTKISLAEYKRATHFAECNPGDTPEDLLEPTYWADTSNKLRPMDEIIAWAADGSWRAAYVVINSGRLWANVKMLSGSLNRFDEAAGSVSEDSGFDIVWRNPHHRFGVIRKSDKSLMREDFQSKEEAAQWLREHMQAMKR